MREHLPSRQPNGDRLQSGIPSRAPPDQPLRSNGLLLKGVVTATYVVDDTSHFQNDGRAGEEGALGVYCDVLSYTNISGMRWRFIPRCMVLQDRGGMHSGRVWKPRAATLDITGSAIDLDKATNPANLDGDHVLIAFVNDNLNEPIIIGGVPHPNADTGVADVEGEESIRQRLQLRQLDGDPDFWKHHGSKYGISNEGDFRIDTRFANDGELDDQGREAEPPTDEGDTKGSHIAQLPLQATAKTTLEDMADPADPKAIVTASLTKANQLLQVPLDAEAKFTLDDFADPENPDPKVTITVTQDTILIDKVNEVTVTLDANTFHILFASGFELLVDDSGQIINLGGDAEWAVIDSKLQTELSRIANEIDSLKWELGKHRHPNPEYPMPLIFGDIAATFKAPSLYIVKQQKPINLRTGQEVKEGNAPMDIGAQQGEYFGVDSGPNEFADLFPGSGTIGGTDSDTVKIKS